MPDSPLISVEDLLRASATRRCASPTSAGGSPIRARDAATTRPRTCPARSSSTSTATSSGPTGPGRHPLPDPAAFAERLAALGFGDTSDIVAYDDAGGTIAARLWWMLDDLGHRARPGARRRDRGLARGRRAGHRCRPGVPARPADASRRLVADDRPRGARPAARRRRAARRPRAGAVSGRGRADRPGRGPHPDRPQLPHRRQPGRRRAVPRPGRAARAGSRRSATRS